MSWLGLIGIRYVLVKTAEFSDPDYVRNDGSRCYFCKDELYSRIEELLAGTGMDVMVSGANVDDLGDYRPGLKAAAEHRVHHPLQEAGLTKADMRLLAQHWGLPNWDKPAVPVPVEPAGSGRGGYSRTGRPGRGSRGVLENPRVARVPRPGS